MKGRTEFPALRTKVLKEMKMTKMYIGYVKGIVRVFQNQMEFQAWRACNAAAPIAEAEMLEETAFVIRALVNSAHWEGFHNFLWAIFNLGATSGKG